MSDLTFIAEIGSNWVIPGDNHNSRQDILRHISQAQDCGACAAKVQIFTADTLYSKERAPEIWERIRSLEFPIDFLGRCLSHANQLGIEFWASIFDPKLVQESIAYLNGLKIASGDITYFDLLHEMAYWANKTDKPLAFSTGAATVDEIETALNIIEKYNPPKIILFHCVSSYPAKVNEMNLMAGTIFKDRVTAIGLSDHTLFSEAAEISVALGYTYFEKHFRSFGTDKTSPDYLVSASPGRFASYIKYVSLAKEIVGSSNKRIFPSEVKERIMARRGLDGLRPNK